LTCWRSWPQARTTLGLATGVLVLPNHHPVVLAKRVATLDALSAGRVRLAVGMGGCGRRSRRATPPFDSRGRRADEQIEVLRLLWEDRPDGADFSGEFFQFAHAACHPTSCQAHTDTPRWAHPRSSTAGGTPR